MKEKPKVVGKEKAVIARVPYDLWKFIKRLSVDEDTTVSGIVNKCLINYKKDREKTLTNIDNLIE